MTPLKAIDGTQVAHFAVTQAALIQKFARAIAIPNVNILGGQVIGTGVALCVNKKESVSVCCASHTLARERHNNIPK